MAGWDKPEHRLDSERLAELFVSLDSQIGLRRDTSSLGRIDFIACGGAVMCFQVEDRGTGDVDIIHPPLEPTVLEAVRTIARRRGVDPHWFNDAPARSAFYGPELASRVLFEGEHMRVMAPDNDYLLGMKVHASRLEDRPDAIWLIRETQACSAEDIHERARRVSESIGKTWEPSERQTSFVDECLRLAAEHHFADGGDTQEDLEASTGFGFTSRVKSVLARWMQARRQRREDHRT